MRSKTTFTYSIFAILLGVSILMSYRNSPPNGRTGAPGDGLCSDAGCHNPQNMSTSGMVSISGLPSTIDADQTYSITVNSSVTSGTAPVAGFEILALDGSNNNAGNMSNPGSGATISSSGSRTYCKHSGGPKNTPASWTFDWTAPSGPDGATITMYAASNLANDNSQRTGDRIVTTQVSGTLSSSAPPLSVDIVNIQNISCFGEMDGEATANASGGTPPYNYMWSNGSTSQTATNLGPGPISVTVSDAGSQSESDNANIIEPSMLQLTLISKTEIDCNGNSTGAASVTGSGGTPPYNYNWSNGANGPNLNGVSAGTYTVTLSDVNNCTETLSVTFEDPELLEVSVGSQTNVSCFDGMDGSAMLVIAGGTQPYNIVWPDGQTTVTANNLSAGSYDATVTDSRGCTETATVEIDEPEELTLDVTSSSPEICAGDENGSATVEANGGTSPYNYEWPDGTSDVTNNMLSEGTYEVTVTDDNDCQTTTNVTINQEDNEAPEVFVNDTTTVYLDSMGQASVTAAMVDNGSTDNCGIDTMVLDSTSFNCSHIGDVTVTLTVTDINGNESSDEAIVSVFDTLIPVLDCPDDMTVNTCTDTVFYNLPQASDNCLAGPPVLTNGLGSGSVFPSGTTTETYQVTDMGGNSVMCSFDITVQNNLELFTSATDASCWNSADGSAQVDSILGGTPPYNLEWETGAMDSVITGLAEGMYQVTVSDDAGCFRIDTAQVAAPDSLYIQVDSVVHTTGGLDNGEIYGAAFGGTPPYTVSWSGPDGFTANGLSLTDLAAGTYSCTVEDSQGCSNTCPPVEIEESTSVDKTDISASIRVYPNPGPGLISISLPENLPGPVSYHLYNVQGSELYASGRMDPIGNTQLLDFSNMPGGLYYLIIYAGDQKAVKKLVIN